MIQYIDKAAVVAEIEKKLDKHNKLQSFNYGAVKDLESLLNFLDTLEVKEVEEKAVSKDLENYAKKESESFAEREYEIDYIDRNALAKGYYWGVKAGVQWQKQKNAIEVKEVDLEEEVANWWDVRYKGLNDDYKFGKYNGHYMENSTVISLAKHFYELGLKAKGE